MDYTKEKSIKKYKRNLTLKIISIILFLIIGCFSTIFTEDTALGDTNNELKVYFLDVGQGDSIYIRVNDYDILIDAGSNSNVGHLMEQLEKKNIDDFEIVIATHPHEDHIGGMTEVFSRYDVKEFYMPPVVHTTQAFESMLNAIVKEGIKAKPIKEGTHLDLGSNATIDVYSPIDSVYEDLNDYSTIMKLTFGDTKLIFTGDAESYAEKEVVAKHSEDLKGEVLKFAHHGSRTSSTDEFIKAVSPKYGIICCGEDNNYGHPHKETVDTISKYDIDTYRTDKQGEIEVTSDGKNIFIKTEK
ncbi:Metallo-beta-lactamase family protein [Clostridium bornimense]|uniref:Metallo-beta-lactamase family protein n=1 Tax=Clostridium bornimense TaxID=1216932 RepID=W6SER9_9CLOT|nr:ComEC/Rec2 family competence protein [Clostridium bornimense]CDM68180.1 Metallo-beta-lactamase family protein [Clostridium bornimense]